MCVALLNLRWGATMMKQLGFLEKQKITCVKNISDKEYTEYKKNLKVLTDFSSKQQLFTILNLNFDEFNCLVSTQLLEFKKNPSMNWPRMEAILINTNRILINFLSSFRTLLDHMEYNLKKIYGNESEKFKRFKNICSEQYDKYFSYRFLYKLRNYSQHCGMPVGSLTINSKVSEDTNKETDEYLAVYFNRDELLNKYDSWGIVKNEISNLPPKIEINAFVKELMECMTSINLIVIEDDIEDVYRSSEYFQNLILPFKNMDVTPAIFDVIDKSGERKKLKVEVEWLPIHLIDKVLASK